MKKLYILSLAALGWLTVANADAQFKKSWDFTKGLSDETIANLNADGSNWASNGTDADGVTNNWKNTTKHTATDPWRANGVVIPELEGLLIDIGSNGDNSVHLATTKLRLTRKSTKITFPKLANGQKVTIVGRSANGTAVNRGIAANYSYMEFQADDSSPLYEGQCIFVGNQVEGSEGTYTFVWKIVTDSADSVDVVFTLTPDAGIDFTLFQIDNGDAPDIVGPANVALVYEGEPVDTDPSMAIYDDATWFDLNAYDGELSLLDTLQHFDVLVYTQALTAESEHLDLLTKLVNRVPVFNVNAELATAMGQGAVDFAEGADGLVPAEAYAESDIFAKDGIEIDVEAMGDGSEPLFGLFTPADDIADEAILVAEPSFYGLALNRNGYLLLPINPAYDGDIAPQGLIDLFLNVKDYLRDSKRDVVAVGKPAFTAEYKDGLTTVTIATSTAHAKIYYTTDGTEATTESALYTEPLQFTEPTTIHVLAVARGYDDNAVSYDVIVKQQAAMPVIAVTQNADNSVITLTAGEGEAIYFNFNNLTDAALSQRYTEPITIAEPATIYAFVSGGDAIDSELASQYVSIQCLTAETIRLDTLAAFDANVVDWYDNVPDKEDGSKSSAYYYWGKNAWNYYSDEEIGTETVFGEDGNPLKDVNGNDSTRVIYAPDPEAVREIDGGNGWKLHTAGQVLTLENPLAPIYGVGNGGAEGRYAEEAIDLLSGKPTTGVITFGAKISGEPYTASIETTVKYAAPFDVVVFCGNGNGSGKSDMEVQVSADGAEWITVGALKLADNIRYYKRTRVSYEGTDEVYVRVAHVGGGTKAQVYDIIILNHGELSSQYDPSAGIAAIEATGEVKAIRMFNMAGQRVEKAEGITLIQTIYADGTTTVKRILVK